jgi:hypothetical protein
MWTKKELLKQSLNEKPRKRVLNMPIYESKGFGNTHVFIIPQSILNE